MHSIRLDRDIQPLSRFRARITEFVNEVCATGRPLLLTQYGRAIAVVIDVRDFEAIRDRLESIEAEAASHPQKVAQVAQCSSPTAAPLWPSLLEQ